MAGFGVSSGRSPEPKKDGQQLEELEKELSVVHGEIRSIIGTTKDRNNLDLETRRKLGTKYVHAAAIAKDLSERYISDEKKQEYYADLCKKLSKKAEEFGSSIQFEVPNTTLDDVKGLDGVKDLVRSFIFMAKNPMILETYKIEGGFGLFMYGAPGTGKTMFAKAIAHELNLPLFVVEPSDIFKSYVGESEAAVKQLFEQINMCKNGAVVFVDECDELFSMRSSSSKDYKSAVTNQLLQNLNGFNTDGSKRILIAATNLPWSVDPAYLRYKRFSHHVHIVPPDAVAIRAIVESKIQGIPLSGVSVDDIVFMLEQQCEPSASLNGELRGRSYYSSADVCGILEDAARIAVEELIKQKVGNGKVVPEITRAECLPITREMFERAIKNKKPSINSELLKKYTEFRVGDNKGGSTW